jgi:hypothetical protein
LGSFKDFDPTSQNNRPRGYSLRQAAAGDQIRARQINMLAIMAHSNADYYLHCILLLFYLFIKHVFKSLKRCCLEKWTLIRADVIRAVGGNRPVRFLGIFGKFFDLASSLLPEVGFRTSSW